MKVFVSSLIAGFEPFRAAAGAAVATLRHEPVMAENFGAGPHSPQVACLSALRASDVVVLLLGERYGAVQEGSGLSATHEEYREARGRKPVIAFVQEGGDPEPQQGAFIAEVQGWEGGLFRGGFTTPSELQAGITRALHDYELANAVAPLNPVALVARATSLIPKQGRNGGYNDGPSLSLAVVGGPLQKVLRPVQIEAQELRDALHQAALFGEARIFSGSKGVQSSVEDSALCIEQERGARVQLDEDGSVVLRLMLERQDKEDRGGRSWQSGIPVLIEEAVQESLQAGLRFAGGVLERVDPTQRLTHLAIAARIDSGDHFTWRTQAEHDASPNSGSMGMSYGEERPAITLSQSRAALRLNTGPIVEDLLVPLRRQWKKR